MNKQYVNSAEIKRLKASLREKTKSLEESNRKLEEVGRVVSCDLKGPARRIEPSPRSCWRTIKRSSMRRGSTV